MCGRFTSARKRAELLEEFRIERDRVTEPLAPDYNVAPTKPVYAVLTRGERGPAPKSPAVPDSEPKDSAANGSAANGSPRRKAPSDGAPASGDAASPEVARELRVVRWGLVPSWAKDPSIGSRLINARSETVASKPAFRGAFARRRCLLPADGFYEWISVTERGKTHKQPYYIHRADGGPLAFAGLYELWRDKSYPDDHPRAWLWTAVIITTRAEDEVGRIHDRMPMVIDPGLWADWLDPAQHDAATLHALLTPAAAGKLASYPVSRDVNSVRNNGPALIQPLSPEEAGDSGGGHGGRLGGGRPGEGGPRDRHRHLTAPPTLF
jgi:putative SOS response-associated peptidase YedK